MTNTYFKSKEQYFQFRSNFAAATNNVKSKSTCCTCDEYHRHEQSVTYDTGMSRIQGWLHAEHFIFLNIIHGKPIHYGFAPVTNKNKLTYGGNIWPGLDVGVRALKRAIHSAKDITQIPQNAKRRGGKAFREFIEPIVGGNEFLNVQYMKILLNIEPIFADYNEYYTTFGEGVKIARKMVEEELKPKNYEEFMQIVDEINNEMQRARLYKQ